MFNKKAKHTKSGFVREKTKGTTNEISYSVLEGKREKTAPKDIDPWDLVTQENTKAKEGALKRNKRIIILLLSFVCVVVMMFLITFGASIYQKYTGSIDYLQNQERETLSLIENNNDLNNMMNNLLSGDGDTIASVIKEKDIQDMQTKLQDKTDLMREKKSNIEGTVKNIATSKDINMANECMDAINAQIEIIECYKDVVEYARPYIVNRAYGQEAMDCIVQGDENDRQATSLLLEANSDAAEKSKELAELAKDNNTQAITAFENISSEAGTLFSEYIEFCELRIKAQEAAILAAQAYIDRNKEELESQNSVYNEYQAKATEIAESWNETPQETLDNEFYQTRSSDESRYRTLVERLNNDKSKVSTYLG